MEIGERFKNLVLIGMTKNRWGEHYGVWRCDCGHEYAASIPTILGKRRSTCRRCRVNNCTLPKEQRDKLAIEALPLIEPVVRRFIKKRGFLWAYDEILSYVTLKILDYCVYLFDPAKAEWTHYVSSTAKKACLNWVREEYYKDDPKPISLEELLANEDIVTDCITDPKPLPPEVAEMKDECTLIDGFIEEAELSELEMRVYVEYIGYGHSYEYMAEALGITAKQVNNALQRARIKVKQLRQEKGWE